MKLRELKKEVTELPNIEDSVKNLQEYWLKPLRANTNQHLPSLQHLSPEEKKELNKKITNFHNILKQVRSGQMINEKLRHYAHYLIELKLTTLNGDKQKSKLITDKLLYDQFNSIRSTIEEVQQFEHKVNNINRFYNHLNDWLQKNISLEENLLHLEQPHKKHLQALLQVSRKQKELTKKLGQEFVELTRQTRIQNDAFKKEV